MGRGKATGETTAGDDAEKLYLLLGLYDTDSPGVYVVEVIRYQYVTVDQQGDGGEGDSDELFADFNASIDDPVTGKRRTAAFRLAVQGLWCVWSEALPPVDERVAFLKTNGVDGLPKLRLRQAGADLVGARWIRNLSSPASNPKEGAESKATTPRHAASSQWASMGASSGRRTPTISNLQELLGGVSLKHLE